jgi:hypothetical protein
MNTIHTYKMKPSPKYCRKIRKNFNFFDIFVYRYYFVFIYRGFTQSNSKCLILFFCQFLSIFCQIFVNFFILFFCQFLTLFSLDLQTRVEVISCRAFQQLFRHFSKHLKHSHRTFLELMKGTN